jgi:hypothetical protein
VRAISPAEIYSPGLFTKAEKAQERRAEGCEKPHKQDMG